jgi:hypothetical protein
MMINAYPILIVFFMIKNSFENRKIILINGSTLIGLSLPR